MVQRLKIDRLSEVEGILAYPVDHVVRMLHQDSCRESTESLKLGKVVPHKMEGMLVEVGGALVVVEGHMVPLHMVEVVVVEVVVVVVEAVVVVEVVEHTVPLHMARDY